MLTDKIHFPNPSTEPEDILSSSLGVIFPDDITNQHGDSLTPIIYLSPVHGAIHLTLADPQGEDNRRLFSHFLWNAAVLLAEYMEEGGEEWGVAGTSVLEVGAGTGLGGLVACLRGARRTVVSDYPAEEVLENIRTNVERNVTVRRGKEGEGKALGEIEVRGHEWGVLDDGFAVENKSAFGRVLVADCLWMPWQHGSLRRSICWFLSEEGRAWVVAGFHTGREKMRGFFDEAACREDGLVVEKIWERNADGAERAWVEDRGIEDVTERKRWLVVAVLKKATG
ncbi:Protein N-terminal and lysine N-methyltransferase [Lachnellula hyalina]|uniref:Protein N-terminal and lysine N-methyltransferase n=1 Tax=Lachnellula hyalina TaxID=1316788 RepID=A0A8H8U149_9HELO|nr:Protein N-terminal and lysine N-methyltransferase [Lachnellula hyalina]TVY30026.1 Protein N-terminal and lysine N-methyltransferase [Lachnellula hyalina]